MFPVEAETEGVAALLPRQAVGQLIAVPGRERRARTASKYDTSPVDSRANRSKAKTVRAILGGRGAQCDRRRKVGKSQIVHQLRRQDARQGRHALFSLVGPPRPARWQARGADIRECAVAIVGVAREGTVIGVQSHIHTSTDLVAVVRG